MKNIWILTGAAAAVVVLTIPAVLARGPVLQPMTIGPVGGSLRIQQSLPGTCDNVDQSTPATGGRIELSPADGIDVPGGKQFVLTRANVTFAPFSVHRECMTQNVTKNYSGIAVQLTRTGTVTATPVAPGVYTFTIPRDQPLFYETALVNGELQPGYMPPKDDVTGTIDLVQRLFTMRVTTQMKLHFEWGCVPYAGCVIDEDREGTLTATLSGEIALPDADRDGVADQTDNCRFASNPDQGPVPTPSVTAPAPVTLASCLDSAIGTPVGTDICDGGAVTFGNNAPAQFSIGSNMVTWTGTDAKGRTATAGQEVTVVDTTKPAFTFVPLDIARNNCGPVGLGTATAADDCAGTPKVTNNSPGYFLNGPTTVTWTATDVSGNAATASQTVTVTDTTPPEVACTPLPTATYFRIVARDACLGATSVKFGSYAVSDGEIIKIEETGKSGVQLQGTVGADGIRHFLVAKGGALITAADQQGNAATALCGR